MRLLPRTLAGQLILFLLSALVITQVASFFVFTHERQKTVREVRGELIATRMVTVVRLLSDVPVVLQDRMLNRVSSKRIDIRLGDTPLVAEGAGSVDDANLARKLADRLGDRAREVRMVSSHDPTAQQRFGDLLRENLSVVPKKTNVRHRISILLSSGIWLNLDATTPISGGAWFRPVLVSMGLMGITVVVIVVIVIRRLTRPLRSLSQAAESFGRGEAVAPIPETGPEEIRAATETFNRMSSRLSRFVQDRMQILSAVSHDLRTPIASLRLQAELIEDEDARTRMIKTLTEMQEIAESTLDLAREDASQEDTRLVDLTQLIEAVCNDLTDLGFEIEFDALEEAVIRCRIVAVRRALRNLLENAVTYGARAQVSLHQSDGNAVVTIDDHGPGIPDHQLDQVFEPFLRLEPSRAQETGGVGLGLAIARSIARGHGGDIMLSNRDPHGLRAELRLPLLHPDRGRP